MENRSKGHTMELPKRERTADRESVVLTLDGEKQFEGPQR